MADETHKLQKDPPEGSREVVDRELERQKASKAGKDAKPASAQNKKALDEAAPQTAKRPGP